MGGQLLVFAGSLAGIALLVLAAKALGLGRGAQIADEAEARELADNAICGFDAATVILDTNGQGALLDDAQGRIILLKPHGAQFAAQLLEHALAVTRDGSRLTIAGTTLELGDAARAWEERLKRLDS